MTATTNQKGQIVNRTGLSDVFGVALNTIDSWIKRGCPVVQKGGGRGQEWKFNTADVGKWLRADAAAEAKGTKDATVDELKRRESLAKTEMAELELAKAKSEVAPVAEFEKVWAMAMGQLRQNIMNVPQRVVLTLLGETDETVFKQKLREELILALEQTAEADFFDDEEVDE